MLNENLPGVDLSIVDSDMALMSAIDSQYDALRAEYAQTHPDQVDRNGNLTEEGIRGFNTFINQQVYGEAGMTGTTGRIIDNIRNVTDNLMERAIAPEGELGRLATFANLTEEQFQQLLDLAPER